MSQGEMERWSKDEAEIAPLSLKERKFVDSLKSIGFQTTIEHHFVGRSYSPDYKIIIQVDSSSNDVKNCKELEILLQKLLNTLYNDVIADSIIYDTGNFQFDITGNPLFDDSICNKKYEVYNYPKRFLEEWNHFKVEKTSGNDQYYRKQI